MSRSMASLGLVFLVAASLILQAIVVRAIIRRRALAAPKDPAPPAQAAVVPPHPTYDPLFSKEQLLEQRASALYLFNAATAAGAAGTGEISALQYLVLAIEGAMDAPDPAQAQQRVFEALRLLNAELLDLPEPRLLLREPTQGEVKEILDKLCVSTLDEDEPTTNPTYRRGASPGEEL